MSAYRALADTPVALSDVRSWWQVDIERVSLSQLFLSQFIALAEIRIFLGVGAQSPRLSFGCDDRHRPTSLYTWTGGTTRRGDMTPSLHASCGSRRGRLGIQSRPGAAVRQSRKGESYTDAGTGFGAHLDASKGGRIQGGSPHSQCPRRVSPVLWAGCLLLPWKSDPTFSWILARIDALLTEMPIERALLRKMMARVSNIEVISGWLLAYLDFYILAISPFPNR